MYLDAKKHLMYQANELILNSTDITGLEPDFLDPGVDIEDYFD